MSDSFLRLLICQLFNSTVCSIQPNAVVVIPLGGVREYYPISRCQAGNILDGIDGATAEPHRRARGVLPVLIELENTYGSVVLPNGRTRHIHNVGKTFQLDGSLDRQIRARARW